MTTPTLTPPYHENEAVCLKCRRHYRPTEDDTRCPECSLNQERLDHAWAEAVKHSTWEQGRDPSFHEWRFSVQHVRRFADHVGLKITWNQAEYIVNNAESESVASSPFDFNEAELAVRKFCEWSDLAEGSARIRQIIDA